MKRLALLFFVITIVAPAFAAEESVDSRFVAAIPGTPPATREPPTLGAKPPEGGVVLFDGKNLDAWAKKSGKDWLKEDGPAQWKLVGDDAVEVIPATDSLISRRQFGDVCLHAEFRTLGAPTNSGIYFQTRYEVDINESFGRTDGNPCGSLGNCTPKGTQPKARASRPPLVWQTLDVEFKAPRFDAAGKRIAKARATVLLNGVELYKEQELDPPTGAAGRLGEAATGPIMLQEHGMPVQFRNIWLVENAKLAAAATDGFKHPGVLINRAQLDFIKDKVATGVEPWKSAFEMAKASELGALDYTPKPRDEICCGPRSTPDLGCKDEQRDSEAAYTQALLWHLTGNKTYAANAIKIMNAWSATLTGGHKLENGPVQAAWCAEVWPRAAEIIRYTNAGWAEADIAKFKEMLAQQYVPSLISGSCENGNKELSMSEALINIGVFNDARATFDAGVKMWRGRAPATIYLTSDGPAPVKAANCDEMPIWGNKGYTTPFVDGLLQETCRDSQHANLALSALVNAAETALQQGLDLYAEQGQRIIAALEYQAQFLRPNSAPVPKNLAFNKHPTWEIAYNHFHNRLGIDLPKIAAVLPTNRPTGVNHHMAWETLTHCAVGNIGLPITPGMPSQPTAAEMPKRPRVLGLSHIALFVHDIEKSRVFYKDFLGFDEPFSINSDDGSLHLTWIKINDRQTIELFPEKEAGSDRLNHIALEVEDAEAMRVYLASRGVKVPDQTERGKIGNFNYMIKDPDGHLVEIVQYVPDGWTLREKGNFLPDTRISTRAAHMGILVGDLEASLKFYLGVLGGHETWRGGGDPKALSWVNVKVPDGEDYVEMMLYQTLPAPDKRGGKHHLCLEVPDIEKAKTTLDQRAARVGYARVIEINTGVNRRRQINLFDPDGTRVELMEPNTVDGVPTPSSVAPPPVVGKTAAEAPSKPLRKPPNKNKRSAPVNP